MKKTRLEHEMNVRFLREHLSPVELWGQLAEEAAELSQAALKMQRLYLNNKPAKTTAECRNNVIEEHADLHLLFQILEWSDTMERREIMEHKAARWVNRLTETDLKAYIDLRAISGNNCVFCGAELPEGRLVCPACELKYSGNNEQ